MILRKSWFLQEEEEEKEEQAPKSHDANPTSFPLREGRGCGAL